MIEATIDSVEYYQDHDGAYVSLKGWAFADEVNIMTLAVCMNETCLGYLPYGCWRADVSSTYGSRCPSACVGYQGRVRLLAPLSRGGSLSLRLVITTSDLLVKELAAVVRVSSETEGSGRSSGGTHHNRDISGKVVTALDSHPSLAAPNFFILGAAKCGTTSLYHALQQHPQIHLSRVKEPSFFSSGFQIVKNPIEYFNLFPHEAGKERYGEASHVYFSAPETAPVLRQLFPQAKFLLIVRNPVHRAYSLFNHMSRAGDEVFATFEEALAEEDTRFCDAEFKNNCPQYFWNYMYVRSSFYDIQLQRYLEHFPLNQFFILTLGEWKSDPKYWQTEIFRFLEIDASVQVTTEPQNQAPDHSALSEQTRSMLTIKFQGMRERLESMIGRRFRHWEH